MKLFWKLIKYTGIGFLILLFGFAAILFFSGPDLPGNTDSIIENVINSDIPEYVKGKSGYVESDNIKIWYESILPKDSVKGTILLFMGISNDALGWPQKFIDAFVNSGYGVIRFDYRGTGLSDWRENWKQKPYSLADLAKDAIVILDSLKIKKAHLIGASLGGMVAQEVAIRFPERILSLTSVMSSGDIIDPELPGISKQAIFKLILAGIKYGIIKSEKNTIKLHVVTHAILRGNADYEIEIKGLAEQVLYNIRKRKGYNPDASPQHQEAVFRSESRYDKLKYIKVPVLIIHGKNDPLIPIEHSKRLTSVIPNSKSIWYDNMGHDLPDNLIETITKEIIANFAE